MKRVISVIVVVVVLTTLLACDATSASKTSTTPTPELGTSTKAPEDIIPLTVSGFELIEKETHVSPLFGGPAIKDRVEYYDYSFFKPETNSKFESKVKSLTVWVYLFKDVKYCDEYYTTRTGNPVLELQVNNNEAVLLDNEFSGGDGEYYEVFVYQRHGKLLIISRANSTPSPHRRGSYPCTWDKPVVKEAAIEGLKATRL